MPQRMTWEMAKAQYPDEWIAFVDYKKRDGFVCEGLVIAHHPDRKAFYTEVKKTSDQFPHLAVRYTGLRVKNQDLPLLWQITDMS